MESDLTAATVTETGTAVSQRARLKAVAIAHAGSGGNVVFRDGGGSGTTILTIATPAAAGHVDMSLPSAGLLFKTDIHVTVGDATSVTVIWA